MSEPVAQRSMMWVDGVGGFLLHLGDVVSLGQPVQPGAVDIPILGDLSDRHARIRRDAEGYSIEAIRKVALDGSPVLYAATLSDGAEFQLGQVVRMRFRQPNLLSTTARLELLSRHRTQPPSDGILLLGNTCVLGPAADCHVVCRQWPDKVVVFRDGDRLWCQANGKLEVDGKAHKLRAPLARNSRIRGDWFSMVLESV